MRIMILVPMGLEARFSEKVTFTSILPSSWKYTPVNTTDPPPISNPYRAPTLGDAGASAGEDFNNEGVLVALQSTRPWVLFLGILGLVGAGLMLLGGFGVIIYGAFAGGGPFVGMGVIYFIFSLLYIAPSIMLIQYANKIRTFTAAPSAGNLKDALTAQKSFWKFVGVMALIVLVIYAVMFFVGIFGAFASMQLR